MSSLYSEFDSMNDINIKQTNQSIQIIKVKEEGSIILGIHRYDNACDI